MRHGHRRELQGVDTEHQLLPALSILVILVPVLLYAFDYYDLEVQGVGQPRRHGCGYIWEPDNELTIVVSERGFTVYHLPRPYPRGPWGTEIVSVDGCERADLGSRWRCLDFSALHNHLVGLKKRFPKQEKVRIAAEPDTPWQVIARTVDCARLRLEGEPFVGGAADRNYVSARPLRVDEQLVTLFPHVVFLADGTEPPPH